MNANTITPFPALPPGQVCLVIHPSPTLHGRLLELAAQLAVEALHGGGGRLLVLDGGNSFNVYPVARGLRQRTPQVTAALQCISVARAFTCFEMASLLQRACQALPGAPATAVLVALVGSAAGVVVIGTGGENGA